MAQRATSLGPEPSLFFCFCFFCFCCFVFFGGFKGQVRWPKGPPHLALNPPYFLFVFCFCFFFCFAFFFAFLSLCFIDKKTCFPPKKGHFCCSFFCVSLCFFLAFLGPPPFSLSLSWCLSCSFRSSFLSVYHFCILFLLFLFVLYFLSSCSSVFVFFFFFFCLLSVFWIIILDLFLLCILFSCCCCFLFLLLSYFVIFWMLETTLKNMEIPKTTKIKHAEKEKRTFWQEQLAQVCSRIVSFFVFCVSFNFAYFAENTIKIGVSAPSPPKKHNKNNKLLKLKTGPS